MVFWLGLKSICVVEYAPFQKVPKKGRKKEDAKLNTIEKGKLLLHFLFDLTNVCGSLQIASF